MPSEHKMVKRSDRGFGAWFECTHCGAAKHSGYWWRGGYKSQVEPVCPSNPFEGPYRDWIEQAEVVFTGDVE